MIFLGASAEHEPNHRLVSVVSSSQLVETASDYGAENTAIITIRLRKDVKVGIVRNVRLLVVI